jgi:hypothetical protein
MENKAQVFDKRGKLVACDDGIVPDGCGVRTSIMLMDSVQRAIAEDLQVTDAYGAYMLSPLPRRSGWVDGFAR